MTETATNDSNNPGPLGMAVTVTGVARVYQREEGDVRALDGVSLSVEAGASVALTGASGSGKSTLLFLMAGLDVPSHGTVSLFGEDLGEMPVEALADVRRRRLGIVFQNYHLLPALTVCENVMLPLVPELGMSLESRARALQCIEDVGLEKRLKHLPKELSGGEQQRVSLARAMVMRPALILADEPTGNLDRENADLMLGLLFGLAKREGAALVIATHDPSVAGRCARQVRFEAGKVVAAGR